jgi:hypothetical protein
MQLHEPGCGDWPYGGLGSSDLPDGCRAVLLQKALAYRTAYQSRSKIPVQTGATFVATNNGVQYSLAPTGLIITQGSTVLSYEPMLEYWSA